MSDISPDYAELPVYPDQRDAPKEVRHAHEISTIEEPDNLVDVEVLRRDMPSVRWLEPYFLIDDLDKAVAAALQVEPWQTATLLNGWTGNAYYRKTLEGDIELDGKVTGGATGTVAFTLPADHRPVRDFSFLTDMVQGTSFNAAQVVVTQATGNVVINFPMP
jgi:hypothetical protein